MRETGPVRKQLDSETVSAAYIGVARTQLGILKNLMKLGGLPLGARTVRFEDGAVLRVSSINGQDAIDIVSAPTVIATEPKPIEVVTFPDDIWTPTSAGEQFALFNGAILPDADNNIFRPMYLNDVLVNTPDTLPHYLSPSKPAVRYRRSLGGGIAVLVARTDLVTGLPLSLDQQPTELSVKTLAGRAVGGLWKAAVDVHAGNKTSPPWLGYVSFPDTLSDVVVEIDGTLNGKTVAKGQVLVERTLQLGAVCPTDRSTQSGGGGGPITVDGTGTANGFALPFDVNQVIPCASSLVYNYSFAPIVASGSPYPPASLGFLLFQMTADPSAANSVFYKSVSPVRNAQGAVLASILPALPAATWTQGGGNITFSLVGGNQLKQVGNITARGTYTANGTLTWTDGVGNTQAVTVAISYTAQ